MKDVPLPTTFIIEPTYHLSNSLIKRPGYPMADRNQQSPQRFLRQVYPDDKSDTDIDIIAIHGLDTKSPETWIWVDRKNPKIRINWLRDPDMLPSKVDRVRIFTCEWPADLLQKSIPTTLEESARFLLDSIRCHLTAHTSTKDRPILFIASCLGGIILIKALEIENSGGHDERNSSSLRKATRGIIFLATPFRGTAFKDMPDQMLKAWASLQDRTVTSLIDYTKGATSFLDELVNKFIQLQKVDEYHVFTFWEADKTIFLRKFYLAWMFSNRVLLAWLVVLTSTWLLDLLSPWLLVFFPLWLLAFSYCQPKQLVDKSSASLQGFESQRLNRRHVLMNKFSYPKCGCMDHCMDDCPECRDFKLVYRKIQDMLRKIREGSPLEQADAWISDKYYTTDMLKIDRLSGDQLSMDQCYINLVTVEHRGRDAARSEGSKIDPFSLLARLKIETPDKDIQVELQALFNPRKGPDGHTIQPRRIFIRGRAGVGKTTLCKKMVHDFIYSKNRKDPIWNDLFDRILWVPLRNLKRKPDKGYNFEGLFLRDFFLNTPNREHLARELERELDATKCSRTLFVLDGLDEVSEGLETDNEMHQFLKFLLKQPNVIITSRPFARFSYNLHPDLELETIGFYPDQVNTYVEKAFTDPATAKIDLKASEIWSFLQDHWLIQGLVRIPIQLDALCYTWNKSSLSGSAPETMTAMYQAIEHRLWKKDILRLEKKTHNGKLVTENFIQEASRAKIEGFVKDEISFLECLAFAGLHNDIIYFGTEHRNAIADQFVPDLLLDMTLPRLSFLRRSDPLAEDYHFLHLTYQEYFAARYFIRQWTSTKDLEWPELKTQETRRGRPVNPLNNTVDYLREHKYNARYNVFWRFVAGLLGAEGGKETLRFFHAIEEEPRDLLGPVHQRLVMHCLSEITPSQENPEFNQLREHLEGQLKQWLLFECNFEFNNAGRSQLAAEMECPEKIIKDILQEESEDIKGKILNSLIARPRLSPAITKLVASYLGDDVSIRLKTPAARALIGQSALPEEIVQAVAALLKDPDGDVRFAAAQALSGQSALPEDIVQALPALLKDPDRDVRTAAAHALSGQSALPEEIVQALAALLKDPSRYVRTAAAQALSRQSALPEEIVQALAALLKGPGREVRFAAAQALIRQSALPEKILQAVAALLKDLDRNVRAAAARALSGQSTLPEKIVQALAALLKNPDRDVRTAAAQALRRQSALPEKIVQAMAALLKNPDRDVRTAAAQALRRQSALPEKIVQALAALLKDPDRDVRLAAAQALSGQSALPEEIVQALAALLKDPSRYVRTAAAQALSRQSALPEEIVQVVAVLLKDPDRSVRLAAAQALSGQSALPEEIVQALAALLKDPSRYVRSAASQVLVQQAALPDERFHCFLLKLDRQLFNNVYGDWLRRSFSDYLTWYVKGNNYSINLPEGGRNIPFHQLQSAVQEAQASSKVPIP